MTLINRIMTFIFITAKVETIWINAKVNGSDTISCQNHVTCEDTDSCLKGRTANTMVFAEKHHHCHHHHRPPLLCQQQLSIHWAFMCQEPQPPVLHVTSKLHVTLTLQLYFTLHLKVKSLSRVRLFATSWTVAYQAPQSMEFSRQEYWSGLPFL